MKQIPIKPSSPPLGVVQLGSLTTLSKLKPDQKKRLWSAIQEEQPEKADLMKNDPFLKRLQNELGGEFVMPTNEVARLLNKEKP